MPSLKGVKQSRITNVLWQQLDHGLIQVVRSEQDFTYERKKQLAL